MKKVITLLFCYCLFFNTIEAQKYNFKNFSVGEGLTQSEVHAICEDIRGNLWFGSMGGGIVKYDGYTFTSYREENGLTDNFVNSIVEDTDGKLWIGTEQGLCVYDGRNFKTIEDSSKLVTSAIKSILKDNAGILWFASANGGLYRYNGKSFEQVEINTKHSDLELFCLYQTADSSIWLGTNKGVCNFRNNRFSWYTKADGLAMDIVRAICEDEEGNIWFATYGGGISSFNNNTFTNYTVYDGLCNNTVYAAFNDKNGSIWFGTAHGVSKYDGESFKNYNESSGLASNVVVCIHKDASDNMWFGTSGGGLSKFDSERFTHYTQNERMGRLIYSIVQAPNGSFLFGSSKGGVTVFDGKSYTLLNTMQGFTDSRVLSLHCTTDSTLWFGTLDDGAYKFKSAGFQHFSSNNGLNSSNITSITSDILGNVWFSSLDSGICVYNAKIDSFYIFNEENGLASNSVYIVKADKLGNIWVATSNDGLNRISWLNPEQFKVEIKKYTVDDGLNDNSIKSIAVDTSNNVYIGTAGGGINIYDGKEFISLTKKNGLCSDNIYLLMFDNEYNLWIGTEQGVDKISLDADFTVLQKKHYGRNEGFTGIEVYRNSCFKDTNGDMWFGTVNGATKYNPSEDKILNIAPKTFITGIKLFYEKIEGTEYVDSVTSWYPIPLNLTLPHKKNNLTFEFVGIYHRNPHAVKYKWKLEGADEDWSPALHQREVTYSNLELGMYTFKVMSCNEFDVWNNEPATFRFVILPPMWQRWWFIAVGIFLLAFVVGLVVYSRFKRIKTKNRITQEKLEMEKNIIELEQEAARLQMNPHFIFNSLNSIQGFIAVNDAFKAKRYLAKFARLMRLILENAREELIPLENEVEILENYLELEKLSTNNKFEFKISVNESINAEIVEIPPMMLQPFVENAVVHGIKSMEGNGLIQINFKQADKLIVCEIIDNGIGRKKAAEIKKQRTAKHKSTGISVTKKRLEQFNAQTGLKAGIEIEDLIDASRNSLGTKVIISVPFESY